MILYLQRVFLHHFNSCLMLVVSEIRQFFSICSKTKDESSGPVNDKP